MVRFVYIAGLLTLLSACGNPLDDVTRLSDVAPTDQAAALTAAPPAEPLRGGLFARLLNRTPDSPEDAAIAAAVAEAQAAAEGVDDTAIAGPSQEDTLPAPASAAEPPRRGLFGLFRGNRREDSAEPAANNPEDAEEVIAASVVTPPEQARTERRGLFGRRAPAPDQSSDSPDARTVEPGTALPFGEIARVCNLPGNRRGRQVANVSGFRVYDSIPNSTAARPFYITGFEDGCARIFTAAVVVPADAETHEFIRYQALTQRPYNDVDNAYEAIKASACRVGRGQPCGGRIRQLSRNLHFLTVYRGFGGSNLTWAEILLHNGEVVAMDISDG